MKGKLSLTTLLAGICLLVLTTPVLANNIAVGTVTITDINTSSHYANLTFNLSWDNSWRTTSAPNNWDAAWVFVKYKVTGGDWKHATLNATSTNHTIPAGYTCSVGLTGAAGKGVFIYRDAVGIGTSTLTGVKLRWEYGTDGVADDATVTVKVFAIEMVYILSGSFYVGDADLDQSKCFYKYGTTGPYRITSEGVISIGKTSNYLWAKDGLYVEISTLPAVFPKGYDAFYCMKHELSQGQYADFLNTLTGTQDGNRFPDSNGDHRHTIGGSVGSRSAGVPDRACNRLSWMDGCAYADWAGLRPMTELEFEKACRGTQAVVDDEHAWGNANVADFAYTLSSDGEPNATVSNAASDPTGNMSYEDTVGSIDGPLHCGIFATGSSNRIEAGAGYYGVLELSGNLWERSVTLGNSSGRSFEGTHGDGSLSGNGHATNSDWPGESGGEVTGATGAGSRGGGWHYSASFERVSDRNSAAYASTNRYTDSGFRGVRSAP